MSEDAESPKKAQAAPPKDAMQDMARDIYAQICSRIYSVSGGQKPQPMAVAKLAFDLAEAFEKANLEFNPVVKAAHEAKNKASVNLADVNIDFAALSKPK